LALPDAIPSLAEAQVAAKAPQVSGCRGRGARPPRTDAVRVRRRADGAAPRLCRRRGLLRAELQRQLRGARASPAPAHLRRGRSLHSGPVRASDDDPLRRGGAVRSGRPSGVRRRADLETGVLRGAAGHCIPRRARGIPAFLGSDPAAGWRVPTRRRCPMRRTFVLFALAFASLAAATVAALVRPGRPVEQKPSPPPASVASDGALRMQAALERLYLPENRSTTAYLQVDLSAAADPSARRRVPVNAVLILDRSGSMRGVKIERARDAARSLVQALGPEDRLAIVEFSSDARVLVPSTPVSAEARRRARPLHRLAANAGRRLSRRIEPRGFPGGARRARARRRAAWRVARARVRVRAGRGRVGAPARLRRRRRAPGAGQARHPAGPGP